MLTFPFSLAQAITLLCSIIRLSTLFYFLPFFTIRQFPYPVKIALVLVLSGVFVFYGNIPQQHLTNFSIAYLACVIVQELLYALSLALVFNIFFYGVQAGIEISNIQMGFSMAQLVDPNNGTNSSVLTSLCTLLINALFFIAQGHYILLHSIKQSFTLLPIGGIHLSQSFLEQLILYGKNIFIVALQVASPIITAILLVDLAISLIAKSIPTMNLMLFGFPIKIAVGLTIFVITIQLMTGEVDRFIKNIPQMYYTITKQL